VRLAKELHVSGQNGSQLLCMQCQSQGTDWLESNLLLFLIR